MRVARRLHLTSITDRQNDVACSGSEQFHTIHMMTLPHHTPWVAPDTSNDVTLPSNDCFRALLHSVSHGATRDNFCRLSVKDQALRLLLWHRSCYPPALDAGVRCAAAVSTVPQDHNAKANAMTGTATKSLAHGLLPSTSACKTHACSDLRTKFAYSNAAQMHAHTACVGATNSDDVCAKTTQTAFCKVEPSQGDVQGSSPLCPLRQRRKRLTRRKSASCHATVLGGFTGSGNSLALPSTLSGSPEGPPCMAPGGGPPAPCWY